MSETDKENEQDVQPDSGKEKASDAGTAAETSAASAPETANNSDTEIPTVTDTVDELISQDEMETLLSGVAEGDLDVETVEPKSKGGITKYDFAHPAHKLNTKLPMLAVINDRIATSLAPALSILLHQPVDVVIEEFSVSKFHEYTRSLPSSVSISRIKLHPLPASSIVALEGSLVFTIVDCFFGGGGQDPQKNLRRHFTPTEQRIIERVIATTLETIGEAWQPTFPVRPEYVRSELSTEITSPANPSEVILVSKFKIALNNGSGELHIAMPYASIDPARPELTAALDRPDDDASDWSQRFTDMVIDAPLELRGIIAETELTLGDLLNLKEGDFIPLGKGNRARFLAENIPLFEGSIGASNGMISVQLGEAESGYQQ